MARFGWLRPGDVANDTDSDCDEDMEVAQNSETMNPHVFAKQITMQEYEAQKRDFTKTAVDNLINAAVYQRRIHTCSSCWSCWLEAQWSATCMECGGFGFNRPCPICKGKCGTIWKRDIEMSHSNREAFWVGECGLPTEEKERYMLRMILEEEGACGGEQAICEGMQDLMTCTTASHLEEGADGGEQTVCDGMQDLSTS